MSRRYNNDWQNASNPNMAPLPSRGSRGGIGSSTISSSNEHLHDLPPHLNNNSHSNHSNSSPQPSTSTSTSSAEVATTLFIGAISLGVSDDELKSLLNACGPLSNLNRVSPAFGFATFSEPDSVLRALAVLNGRELPAYDPKGKDSNPKPKKLNVKADEKTRKFLDQYEQTLIKTDQDEEKQKTASSTVDSIITKMSDPTTRPKVKSSNQVEVPAHLRDLTEEELPEEHRGSVLSEIDKFRQTSQVREEDKRRREQEMERIKAEERRSKLIEERKKAQAELNEPSSSSSSSGAGAGVGMNGTKVNGFVSSSSAVNGIGNGTLGKDEKDMEPEERDELEEKRRKERKKTESIGQGKEAERSYLHAERGRLAHFERLAETSSKEKSVEEQRKNGILKRSEAYSNGKSDEYEEELFWVNRSTWRSQRQKVLAREREQDALDREEEAKEISAAQKETEKFLAQQAKEMAAHAEEQRKAGILVQDKAMEPLKMKLNVTSSSSSSSSNTTNPTSNSTSNSTINRSAPVLGEAAEDDLTASRRGKLTNIQLGDGLTPQEREIKRKQAVEKIEKELPNNREDLLNMNPKWDWVDESVIQSKYRNQLDEGIEESIGEKVPELTEAVIEKLRGRSSAKEIVEVLEPVLAEESAAFVEQLWRTVLADSLVSAAGLRA